MQPAHERDVSEAELLSRWLVRLCDRDTTTGREDEGLEVLLRLLVELQAEIVEQQVDDGRTNVLALWGGPRVLFSTHLDTVPPFFESRLEDDAIYGRGACDAKGQIVAQLGAVRRLLAAGQHGVAWLGVVGEETNSEGARAALDLAERLEGCRAIVNGEPTGLKIASGQRGVLDLRLTCRGRMAHSSLPDEGVNAIWRLIDWLDAVRTLEPTVDTDLGTESWNLAAVDAGIAPNVIPDRAEARIFARVVPGSRLLEGVRRLAPRDATVELLHEQPSVVFPAITGFERAQIPFGSDAVTLSELVPDATVVLAGPGSIEVAHIEDEHITVEELVAGVDLNERLAVHFLEEADVG